LIKKSKNPSEEVNEKETNAACEETKDTEEVKDDAQEAQSEEIAVDENQKKLDELNDKYLRLLAEYDNFKKRTVREKESIYVDSVGETVTALLPVIDNFERALASFSAEEKDGELYKGIEMIFNQTVETFEKLGVKKIEALGCEFDPELHNAVMHIEDETVTDNTIVEEFQKGYTYRDKVIRYSMVKVAN